VPSQDTLMAFGSDPSFRNSGASQQGTLANRIVFRYSHAMSLAFTRCMSPDAPILLAAVLSGRRRPKRMPWGHVWLRIADRLAAGMPPEGRDGRVVAELLS
jgi:hypothetical protein